MGRLTSLEAIVAAGGTKKTADPESVLLIRSESQEGKPVITVRRLNLTATEKGLQDNAYLKPNDILYVPKTRIAKVNLFVEQYLSNMVPDWIRVSVPFFYSLGGKSTETKIIVREQ